MPIRRDGPEPFFVEDVVRLRKPHPCGSTDWKVYRVGADVGVQCLGCERRVMLVRRELERRMKAFISRGPGYQTEASPMSADSAQEAAVDG